MEHDRATRDQVRQVLESAGYMVAAASDTPAAFDQMSGTHFDLVLLDFQNGASKGKDLFGLTRLLSARAWRLLEKPVLPAELLETVRKSLDAPRVEVISASPGWVEVLVPCDIEAAEQAQDFFSLLNSDLPLPIGDATARVFHELLINAVEWGGRFDPKCKVRVSCLRGHRMLLYRVADPGAGFCDDCLPHAAVHYSGGQGLEHMDVRAERGLRPGGFGLLIARALVDELIYNEAHNEVVFIKYLPAD